MKAGLQPQAKGPRAKTPAPAADARGQGGLEANSRLRRGEKSTPAPRVPAFRDWHAPAPGGNARTGTPRGHDFSRVRVHAGSGTHEGLPSDRTGGGPPHDMFIKGQIGGGESPSAEETSEPFSEPEETVVDPTEGAVELGNSNCPVTAVFSSTLVGKEKSGCLVPDKKFGAATLARFVLHGVAPGAGSTTVGERFKMLSDSHGVFNLLKPNSYTTNGNIFDDCYSLFSTNPLPADLELKVEQNHLLGDQVISKNIVTYTADRITIRSCKRQTASCDFATVCRR